MLYPDSFRQILATTLVAIHLPVSLYLMLLQGISPFWRRIGKASFVPLLAAYAVFATAVVRLHELWHWHPIPWPNWLVWIGLGVLMVAAVALVYTYRSIEKWTLHLVRQIAPDENRRLITDGALGSVRHPRYVTFTLVALGAALITGYPAVIAALGLTVFLFALVIYLEERELLQYFGDEFKSYRRSVPAFWPRFRRSG